MGSILEEYKKQLNDESLTDEEVMQRFKEDEKKFNKEVNDKVGEYEALDMDKFIDRIGGQGTIEDIEEWKRGFMDGFEEAYNWKILWSFR